jgi:hypothetical protein
MMLTDKQVIDLIEDMNKLITEVVELQQGLINLNYKIKSVSEMTLKLIDHTDMPEPSIIPCDPNDGSWIGR